jgi:hypothetical protein
MDTWALLKQELNYHGIVLINHKKCNIFNKEGKVKSYGIFRSIKILNNCIKKQKKVLLQLWDETISILEKESVCPEIIDKNMTNLFIFSIKDFMKYLLCFDKIEKTKYYNMVSLCLSRDVKTFSKNQIYSIPDYKICIDWVSRNISRLLYISKLLYFASLGEENAAKYDIKTAEGIAGPWSRLNLPMEERKFPFGFGLRERDKAKQKQNRYVKGLQNYNNSPGVAEGYYWREIRNEPFSWYDRDTEDPYPSRKMLSGRV